MEFEVYLSGIGGQGVQLIAKVLALAAIAEDRQAMLSGFYGSEMRGGVSLSTVVVGNGKLKALPVPARVSAAVVLHHKFWEAPCARLREGALVVADAEIGERLQPMPRQHLALVPATRIAIEIGSPMVAGMALLASFTTMTGLVAVQSLVDAMKGLVPSHRREHVAYNEAALRAGAAAVSPGGHRLDLDAKPAADRVGGRGVAA